MNTAFTRRSLLVASGTATFALNGCVTSSTKSKEHSNYYLNDSFEFIGPENDSFFSEGPQKNAAGSGRSRHDEVSTAFRLLWDSPRTRDHFAIAQYFENISTINPNEIDRNGNIASYNEEWVRRANPLITGFFSMTNTLPSSGDETAWCAAFVSFILYAAGKPNMFSALSGSYRHYMNQTLNPALGDLVVFEKYGEAGEKGFGHVGFFVSETDHTITVLGGNQRGGTGSTGAVTRTVYAKIGLTQKLHSYRSVPLY